MHWLQVLSHLDPRYGGLSEAVPALADAVSHGGMVSAPIAAFCNAGEHTLPTGRGPEEVSFWPASRAACWGDRNLQERFAEVIAGADGIHLHGLWEQSSMLSAQLARRLGKPVVISAHGMLEPWALRSKRVKKAIYSALVERPLMRRAACLHALTPAEAQAYRRFGVAAPVAIIPNGVTIPRGARALAFFSAHPELAGKRILLFLGRLHPKKGLDMLLDAWACLEGSWPEAHVVLAGPDCDGTEARLKAQIHRLGLRNVTFNGMLTGMDKWDALAAAECFVLPSHSEGLSVSLLEAMGMGVPVIATVPCNMPEVATERTGWQVDATTTAIGGALLHWLQAAPETLAAAGARGRELVRRRYSWQRAGQSMAEVYAWVLGGPRPDICEVVQ